MIDVQCKCRYIVAIYLFLFIYLGKFYFHTLFRYFRTLFVAGRSQAAATSPHLFTRPCMLSTYSTSTQQAVHARGWNNAQRMGSSCVAYCPCACPLAHWLLLAAD
jgi:hypothetical protein